MGTSAWWTDPQQLQVISTWANIGLTAGLLTFAFMQWWVSHAAEKQRRREREADEARELETAYAVLRATAFETWAKLHELEGIDLARISREGLLKPADFLPVAPITVVQSAAKLGPLPSQLTQTGLNLLRDAAVAVEVLNRATQGGGTGLQQLAQNVMQRLDAAEKTLDDAVQQCELAHAKDRDMRMFPGSRSDFGKMLEANVGTKRPLPVKKGDYGGES
jgi:hypothetical protein